MAPTSSLSQFSIIAFSDDNLLVKLPSLFLLMIIHMLRSSILIWTHRYTHTHSHTQPPVDQNQIILMTRCPLNKGLLSIVCARNGMELNCDTGLKEKMSFKLVSIHIHLWSNFTIIPDWQQWPRKNRLTKEMD